MLRRLYKVFFKITSVIIGIMNVGLSTLYDIGSNYTVKLNDKEILIYEEDETRVSKSSDTKKLQEEQEQQLEKTAKDKVDNELSPEEEQLVGELEARDAEVRMHEAAHQSVGGGMTGAASYTYQQGPDGKMYAIGGEVSISMSGGSSPEEAIANARKVAAAAMAAGNPSAQDFSVAASARVMEMKAQQQLAKEKDEKILGQDIYSNESMKNNEDDEKKNHIGIDLSA